MKIIQNYSILFNRVLTPEVRRLREREELRRALGHAGRGRVRMRDDARAISETGPVLQTSKISNISDILHDSPASSRFLHILEVIYVRIEDAFYDDGHSLVFRVQAINTVFEI